MYSSYGADQPLSRNYPTRYGSSYPMSTRSGPQRRGPMTRGYYDRGYDGYDNNLMNDYNEPLYFEDRMFDDENNMQLVSRPTYRKSKMLANPDFGNYHFKKGYSAEVWLNDGETVVLSAHSRKKTYRTHYSPEYLRSFFFGWIGRLLRYFYLDRLFGLHIDTVKTVILKNFIFVTAHIL